MYNNFLFNKTKLKVINLNGKFRWLEQRRIRKTFCSNKFTVCDEKLFAELIELFIGYKMANSLSLCRLERSAQNRQYDNECIESGLFWSPAMFIGYNPIAIRWKNSFHNGFVENLMGYLLKNKLKYMRHNFKEILVKCWEGHLFCRTRCILPRIHHNVISLILESACMKRILLAADSPNLTELKFFWF